MLRMAMAAVISSATPNTNPGARVLAGVEFDKLVIDARAMCPQANVQYLTPAGLLEIEDEFRHNLSAVRRARLDVRLPRSADDGIVACAEHNGASCEATLNLAGFRAAGLTGAFTRFICRSGVVR